MGGQDPKTRNYRAEYLRDHSSPTARKNNALRKKARRAMEKEVGKEALKGKDVDHKRRLGAGGTNSRSNLRVMSVSKNRGRNNKDR